MFDSYPLDYKVITEYDNASVYTDNFEYLPYWLLWLQKLCRRRLDQICFHSEGQ